jgi:hypothetical protein
MLVCVLCTLPAVARAQSTINLSHDLVTLGIAAQNLVPNQPSLDARPLIRAALDYAQAQHVSRITVDKGNYYVLSPDFPGDRFINIYQATDLTIDLAGSTIYFNGGYLQGFSLTECARVTLTNLAIDWVHPPYTHAEITSVDASARTIAYRTLDGWVDPKGRDVSIRLAGLLDRALPQRCFRSWHYAHSRAASFDAWRDHRRRPRALGAIGNAVYAASRRHGRIGPSRRWFADRGGIWRFDSRVQRVCVRLRQYSRAIQSGQQLQG